MLRCHVIIMSVRVTCAMSVRVMCHDVTSSPPSWVSYDVIIIMSVRVTCLMSVRVICHDVTCDVMMSVLHVISCVRCNDVYRSQGGCLTQQLGAQQHSSMEWTWSVQKSFRRVSICFADFRSDCGRPKELLGSGTGSSLTARG